MENKGREACNPRLIEGISVTAQTIPHEVVANSNGRLSWMKADAAKALVCGLEWNFNGGTKMIAEVL